MVLCLSLLRVLPAVILYPWQRDKDDEGDSATTAGDDVETQANGHDGTKEGLRHRAHHRRPKGAGGKGSMRHRPYLTIARGQLRSMARQLPLYAAIMAPVSTLYDIPALSQPWLGDDQLAQPDGVPEVALSAVELFFNISANAVLMLRFSTLNPGRARYVTRASTIMWIVKTVIALVNIAIFAADTTNYSASQYNEGFWCAVVSCIISSFCAQCLVWHWIAGFDNDNEEHRERQARDLIAGRTFMLSVVFLIGMIGLMGLVFSRLEDWTFFTGIYFAVVSMTTIGFGDLYATTTAARILLFPFLLLSIIALAFQITLIIGFFQDSLEKRKKRWRQAFEARRRRLHEEKHPEADLQKEIEFLNSLNRHEQLILHVRDLAFSLTLFLVFFLVGAVIFHYVEGWTYGISLYFVYVVFLTVGYGDYSPATPAGRVFFVIYALLSVPIITSFAVQTVCQVFVAVAESVKKKRDEATISRVASTSAPRVMTHGDHAVLHTHQIKSGLEARKASMVPEGGSLDEMSEARKQEIENEYLTEHLIKLTLQLQREARIIMLSNIPHDEKANTLLRADVHVQRREIKALGSDAEALTRLNPPPVHDDYVRSLDTLDQVKQYRATFGAILATMSQIRHLEGAPRRLIDRKEQLLTAGIPDLEGTSRIASTSSAPLVFRTETVFHKPEGLTEEPEHVATGGDAEGDVEHGHHRHHGHHHTK